jgi:hypothetical protein
MAPMRQRSLGEFGVARSWAFDVKAYGMKVPAKAPQVVRKCRLDGFIETSFALPPVATIEI